MEEEAISNVAVAQHEVDQVNAVPGEWKLTIEEFTFAGCHHNSGGTD